jgi:hypothetical protein
MSIELGKHYSKSGRSRAVKRDSLGFGFAIDRPILWAWLMKFTTQRALNFTFQVLPSWIFNHDHELSISNRGAGDSSQTIFTVQLRQDFAKQTWTCVTKQLYDTSGTGYSTLSLSYSPGIHWKYAAGVNYRWSQTSWNQERANQNKDYAWIRIRYEF